MRKAWSKIHILVAIVLVLGSFPTHAVASWISTDCAMPCCQAETRPPCCADEPESEAIAAKAKDGCGCIAASNPADGPSTEVAHQARELTVIVAALSPARLLPRSRPINRQRSSLFDDDAAPPGSGYPSAFSGRAPPASLF